MMLNKPTWIFPARSGSSLIAKMPRLARGSKPVVHAQLAAEGVTAFGGLDGIDVADDIGDRHVRRRELLDVALLRAIARRWRCLLPLFRERSRHRRQIGRERIVVDLASGNCRNDVVQEIGQRAKNSGLLAWPRSPRRIMLCRERIALTICGVRYRRIP